MATNLPHVDNISDSGEHPAADEAGGDPADEYMRHFEVVENQCAKMRAIADTFSRQPDQDHRLFIAMKYITEQQKMNEYFYDLAVEMSNFLAPK